MFEHEDADIVFDDEKTGVVKIRLSVKGSGQRGRVRCGASITRRRHAHNQRPLLLDEGDGVERRSAINAAKLCVDPM